MAVRRADAPPRAAVARRPLYTRRRGLHTSGTLRDIQRGIRHLHDHGYAVFKGAASPAQTRDIRTRLWDFFEERFPPLNRSKPETWDLLPVNEYGIMLLYGIGQSEAMWRVRELRRVRDVFAAAWEDEDLICDFGGIVAFRPHNCTDRWRTPERWYHVDMNVETYDGFESIQGFLALTDNTEASGGLVGARVASPPRRRV